MCLRQGIFAGHYDASYRIYWARSIALQIGGRLNAMLCHSGLSTVARPYFFFSLWKDKAVSFPRNETMRPPGQMGGERSGARLLLSSFPLPSDW